MHSNTILFVFVVLVLGATGLQPPLDKEYDFIVVGGGTAGAVVASRLSEITDWTVLLLEAGGDEGLILQVPMAVSQTLAAGVLWNYSTEPTPNACQGRSNKRCTWHRGKVLGGSSSVNFMIYTRGNRRDYDRWEAAGNPGWGYKDVLPYFLKSEDQRNSKLARSPYHAVGGPLTVDISNYRTPSCDAALDSVKNLGYPIRDYNGAQQYGFSFVQRMVRKGRRLSTNRAFLSRSVRRRPNLTISIRSRVNRVLLEKNRAVGVEVLRDGKIQHVRARKEVILSAGTLNDPQILMLSGIGPQDHLQELDIPVVKNLSVGMNVQDHAAVSILFEVDKSLAGLTADEVDNMEAVDQWLAGKGGPLSVIGGVEALGYVSTRLNKYGPHWPDLEIVFIGTITQQGGLAGLTMGPSDISEGYDGVVMPLREQPVLAIAPFGLRPKSRGIIRLKSKDPNDPPLFYPNYFSDRHDVEVAVEGCKLALKIAESPMLKKIVIRNNSTMVPGCEGYQYGSDAFWECYLKTLTFSAYHQVGTCKMGPKSDPDAVVDHRLRVYGIQGLRVVDSSIIPTIPGCHMASVAIMIGEKGADMIKQDWGAL